MKSPFYIFRYLPSMPWLEIAGFALLILVSRGH